MLLRNISRYGDLDVPLIGAEVAAGDVVDVTEEQARRLLVMATAFEPADDEAAAIAAELAALDDETTFGPGLAISPDVRALGSPVSDPVVTLDPVSDPESDPVVTHDPEPDRALATKSARSRATTTEVTA